MRVELSHNETLFLYHLIYGITRGLDMMDDPYGEMGNAYNCSLTLKRKLEEVLKNESYDVLCE